MKSLPNLEQVCTMDGDDEVTGCMGHYCSSLLRQLWGLHSDDQAACLHEGSPQV